MLVCISKYYNVNNEHFFVVFIILLSAGLFFFVGNDKVIGVVFSFLAIYFLFQLSLGVRQLFNAFHLQSRRFNITGSFANSGVYSVYIVAQLPILVYDKKVLLGSTLALMHRWIFLLIGVLYYVNIILSLILIYYAQSRTAFVTVLITALAYLYFTKGDIFKRWWLKQVSFFKALFFLLLISCLVVGAYALFNQKRTSAIGRLMKTTIAMIHFDDHFWSGTGLGRFTCIYPEWQAEYFRSNADTSGCYFNCADESYLLFNEPLQLLKEIGVVGFIMITVIFLVFFSLRSSKRQRDLQITLKLIVIAIVSASFTSYSFHVNFLLLLLIFCLISGLKIFGNDLSNPTLLCGKGLGAKFFKGVIFLCILSLLWITDNLFSKFYACENWLKDSRILNVDKKTEVRYNAYYKELSGNGKFLIDYGNVLLQDSLTCGRAIGILELAKDFYVSRQGIEQLAFAYEKNGDFHRAIHYQNWLSDFLPNKFQIKFDLMKLYLKIGDLYRAKKVAMYILNMPIKVYSLEILDIINEARKVAKN